MRRHLAVTLAALATSAVVPTLAVAASVDVPAITSAVSASTGVHGHPLVGRKPRGSKTGRVAAGSTSTNWAGYAQTGSAGQFRSSTASWTVPKTATTYPGYSSTWVGVDGAANSYLTQTGTEADVVNGKVSYYAWWEVITPSDPAPETRFSRFPISPGDAITASVVTNGTTSTMTLTDTTTGQTASKTAAYTGPGASAEWIQEDTDVNGYISTAPNWGSVTFRAITVNGASPALTSSQSIDIVDGQGTQETRTSAPNSTANGFTTTWLATGTQTYTG